MNSESLNRWISIGANLAVLGSIVFLGMEIRQNTEMTRAQITLGRSQNNLMLAESQFNSEYIPDIVLKSFRGEELTETELYRFNTHLRALLRSYDNDLQQFNQGLLGDHIPRSAEAIVRRFVVRNSLGREYWEANKASFSDEFLNLVDAVISDAANSED